MPSKVNATNSNFHPLKNLQELRSDLDSGTLSSVELVQSYISTIEAENPSLNALVGTRFDRALEEAQQADEAIQKGDVGVLTGIPCILKDNLSMEGEVVTGSSRILEGYCPPYTATAVQKLLDAGAIVLGTANMDEFAMGSSNETSCYGQVRNPRDPARVPGGSSGGSAASVAASFAPFALGSDTGGSIRQPAAFCGVTGLKPSYGRVSRYGLFAYGSSLDQIGPITTNVDDAALVMDIISGVDEHDMTTVDLPLPHPSGSDIKGMKIGVPVEFMDTSKGLRPEVKTLLEAQLDRLASAGAEIVEIDLPILDHVISTYYLIANCEASSNLARYDGIRYGRRCESPDSLIQTFERSRGEGFGKEVQTRILLGTYALSAGYYDAYYKKADAIRSGMRQQLEERFEKVDLIVGPTTPDVAFKIGEMVDDPLAMYMQDLYTTFVNLVSCPAMSLPVGKVDGLPVGMQLVAPLFKEERLFRAGRAIEACRVEEI